MKRKTLLAALFTSAALSMPAAQAIDLSSFRISAAPEDLEKIMAAAVYGALAESQPEDMSNYKITLKEIAEHCKLARAVRFIRDELSIGLSGPTGLEPDFYIYNIVGETQKCLTHIKGAIKIWKSGTFPRSYWNDL